MCGIYFEKFGSLKLYDFHTFETREMFGAMNQNLFLSQTMMKAWGELFFCLQTVQQDPKGHMYSSSDKKFAIC